MDDSSFDSTLREFVRNSSLPYEEAAWEQVSRRLHAEPAFSPPPRRRAVPLSLRRAAAAAVFIGLIAVTAWLFTRKESSVQLLSKARQEQQSADQNSPAPVLPATGRESHSAAAVRTTNPSSASTRTTPAGTRKSPFSPAGSPGKLPPAPRDSGARLALSTAPVLPKLPAAAHPQPEWRVPDEVVDFGKAGRLPRRLDVAGGYNLGGARGSFTVGVALRQPLGARLVLDAGLAMVSGSYQAYRTVQTVLPGGGAATITGQVHDSTVASQQEAAGRLLYLQAAPSLSYRIYKGFSAGAGMDAQRLVGGAAGRAGLQDEDGSPRVLPDWDFGLTGRIDLQVTKRLRTGLLYRESVRASSGSGAARGRNYLLVQVGYSLF